MAGPIEAPVVEVLYEPDSYWEDRGGMSYKNYVDSPDRSVYNRAQNNFFRILVNRLRPATLLDFGCGTGKLFSVWQDIPEIHGYDRSRSQIGVARLESSRLDSWRVHPKKPYQLLCDDSDRSRLPYEDGKFDLIVAAEVLLHVLPEEIAGLIGELHRISRGTLAVVTAPPFENPAPHNFNHDYNLILKRYFDITDDHVNLNQRYLVADKREIIDV